MPGNLPIKQLCSGLKAAEDGIISAVFSRHFTDVGRCLLADHAQVALDPTVQPAEVLK
jgi:hypothetical protein